VDSNVGERLPEFVSWCRECEDACPAEDICRTCQCCEQCCDCDFDGFDSDEFGEDPEAEYERRFER
jgi:hypothetical protein